MLQNVAKVTQLSIVLPEYIKRVTVKLIDPNYRTEESVLVGRVLCNVKLPRIILTFPREGKL